MAGAGHAIGSEQPKIFNAIVGRVLRGVDAGTTPRNILVPTSYYKRKLARDVTPREEQDDDVIIPLATSCDVTPRQQHRGLSSSLSEEEEDRGDSSDNYIDSDSSVCWSRHDSENITHDTHSKLNLQKHTDQDASPSSNTYNSILNSNNINHSNNNNNTSINSVASKAKLRRLNNNGGGGGGEETDPTTTSITTRLSTLLYS